MVQQTPINNNLPYRRQSSLGGNKVMRYGTSTEDNTKLVFGKVTQVYYRKGTVDFSLSDSSMIVDNSGSEGTYSAPIPIDFYGVDADGKPFAKTRLIQKGNKVLVAFVNGKTSNPVIIGVYPDDTQSYELIAPAFSNTVNGNNTDDINQTLNQIEVSPHHQIIYRAGNGDIAKSMQGHSFLLVSGNDNFALQDIQRTYKDISYFYGNYGDNDDTSQAGLIESNTPQAPEWLLVHENNVSNDSTLDTHLTRFYVNHKGEIQVVLTDTKDLNNLVVLQGSKDNGFTLMKSFDTNVDNSKDYVKFNVGEDHAITLQSATQSDSEKQSQTLKITTDDILVNGKNISDIGTGTGGGSGVIDDDHIKDIIESTTGVSNWNEFNDKINNVVKDTQDALDKAQQAIEDAKDASEKAQQAGEDAQLAGDNATNAVDDLKKRLVYYLSISPEKDIYIPGKYLILNEDVTVKNGFIKEAYIDNGVISTAKIKDGAITNAKIGNLAVHTAQIADGAITNAKIGNLAVDTANIANGAIVDAKVGHLSFEHMEGELLDASKINVSNLKGDSIEAGTIRADKLIINNLSEISADLGNITSGTIDAGQGNVQIDNLPADDPNMLTPQKKAELQDTINSLRAEVKAQNDFQSSIGGAVPTDLNNAMDNLNKVVAPYFVNMNSTESYDRETIEDDILNVRSLLNNLSNQTITTIGKTADGKNTIYTGAKAPDNPKLGDIWAKPSADGSNQGTFEIYGENGWFSPTEDIYQSVQQDLAQIPKNYYQTAEPTGDIVEGSMWYKTIIDSTNNVSFDMYVYKGGKWVSYDDNALKGINTRIDQIAQTADGKNNIYSSNTAPENPKENDIWIDTAHDNTIKVYIKGQWISPNADTTEIDNQINQIINGTPKVYYQPNQPTGNIVEGSTWYKTGSNNTYVMYTFQNGKWVQLLDSNISDVNNKVNNIQNDVDKLDTINYVPNSSFITNPDNGLSETGDHPLLWKDFSNEYSKVADWGGQPLFVQNKVNYDRQEIDLTKDYKDCIVRGFVDGNNGNSVVRSGDYNAFINRLITVVPSDWITITNNNVDKQSTNANYIAWYDKDRKFITTTTVNGLSSSSSFTQTVYVPYKAFYAKIGFPMGSLNTANNATVIYTCKNMYAESELKNLSDFSNWTKTGGGTGTVSSCDLDRSTTPSSNTKGIQISNTGTQYQDTSIKTTVSGMNVGQMHMLTLYAKASNGGSIRLDTNGQTFIKTIANNGNNWIPLEFNFIAGSDKTLTLSFDAPNNVVQITGIRLVNCGSNNDPQNPIINKNNWNSYQAGSSVTLTDDILCGSNIIDLATGGTGTNYFGYNQGLIEGRGYVLKLWAKADSGSSTLHIEQRGAWQSKDISIPNKWTYIEFPFIFSTKSGNKNYVQQGSLRKLYVYNKGNSNIKLAGVNVYDYNSNAHINGYIPKGSSSYEIDAVSAMSNDNNAQGAYVRLWRNKKPLYYTAINKGITVTTVDKFGVYQAQKTFDTATTGNCNDLVSYLNGLANNTVIAITTCGSHTLDSGLQSWFEKHGVPLNLITSYTNQDTRMAYIGTSNNNTILIQPQFALEGSNSKFQPNVWGGSISSRLTGFEICAKCYTLHTNIISPNSWTTYACNKQGYIDTAYSTFFKEQTAVDDNIMYNSNSSVKVQSSVIYNGGDYQAFSYTAGFTTYGIFNMPYDIAPKATTGNISVVTSTHDINIQASSYTNYAERACVSLEVSQNKRYGDSNIVDLNRSGNNHSLLNYKIDGMGEDGWSLWVRLAYTLPKVDYAFNGDKSNGLQFYTMDSIWYTHVLSSPFMTFTKGTVDKLPPYTDNKTALSQNAVQQGQSYQGVVIDSNGLKVTSGNNSITLNATQGIDIYGNGQHSVQLDNNGNLILRGNLVAGNISGVNIGGVTFTGDNMNLNNVLNVNGAIKSNGVVIDNQGLHVTNGDITLGNTSGTTYTQLKSDGTLVAKNAVLSGALTSNNVNITGGAINLVKPDGSVAFKVDSSGNASFSGNLNGVNITGNNSTLSGTLNVQGTISGANGNVILNNNGLSIRKGDITLGNGSGTTFQVKSDGTLIANNATITGQVTANKLTIASNADVSINVNGQFTVDNKGNVYAGSLTVKNGTLSSSNINGGNIYGSTLNLGNTYYNELWDTNLYNVQYDSYGMRTGYSYKGAYGGNAGTTNVKPLNIMSYWDNSYGKGVYGKYNDNWYRDALTVDCSKYKDGDTIVIQMSINYDLAMAQQGTLISMNVKGKDPSTAEKYFGKANKQQINTGDYLYTWYFTYHSDLGNGKITLEHKVDKFFTGGRIYITSVGIIELPVEQNDSGLARLGYSSKDRVSTRSQSIALNGGSTFKQLYMVDAQSNGSHNFRVASAEFKKGMLQFNAQTASVDSSGNGTYPFGSVIVSGEGFAYMGDGHGSFDFAYSPSSVGVLWGSVGHETLIKNGGPGSDWSIKNGNGIEINRYGNIGLMQSSDHWSVYNFGGIDLIKAHNNGNIVIGKSQPDNQDGIRFESNTGFINMGRLTLSTHGGKNESNNDVNFILGGTGWEYHSNDIKTPAIHTNSLRSLKYDISKVDDDTLLDAVLNTEIGKYHYKDKDYTTNAYRYTPIIDDVSNPDEKEFMLDNLFIDDGGKSLNMQNMVGALFGAVKSLQKQVTDINEKLLEKSIELEQLKNK